MPRVSLDPQRSYQCVRPGRSRIAAAQPARPRRPGLIPRPLKAHATSMRLQWWLPPGPPAFHGPGRSAYRGRPWRPGAGLGPVGLPGPDSCTASASPLVAAEEPGCQALPPEPGHRYPLAALLPFCRVTRVGYARSQRVATKVSRLRGDCRHGPVRARRRDEA